MTKELLDKIHDIENSLRTAWIGRFEALETPEAIIAEAKSLGVELTREEASEALSLLKKPEGGEITDEEMTGIAGGAIFK